MKPRESKAEAKARARVSAAVKFCGCASKKAKREKVRDAIGNRGRRSL